MDPTSNERSSDNEARRKAAALISDSPEQLVALARRHYANSHPNPLRSACPGEATLRASIFSGGLPGDELSAHTLECSECFREYQTILASYRAERSEGRPLASRWGEWLRSFTRRPAPAYGAAFAMLLLLFTGAYLWWGVKSPVSPDAKRAEIKPPSPSSSAPATNGSAPPAANERAVTIPVPQPPQSPEPTPRQAASPLVARRAPARREKPRPSEAHNPRRPGSPGGGYPSPTPGSMEASEVDLSEYERTRGGGGGTITLRRVNASLTLRLPEGARRGRYRVSILDAAGRRLRSVNAESPDGLVLKLRLDLATLAPGRYSLELTDAAGNIFDYAVALEGD